ncbi:hypothetical protein MBLNU13_g08905t3 [Cladosporium sp. NU13]
MFTTSSLRSAKILMLVKSCDLEMATPPTVTQSLWTKRLPKLVEETQHQEECNPTSSVYTAWMLSTENLCAGLRPMDFWEEVVNSETVSTDKAEKLRYNVARLAGAAIVQEYHVMIQEGLTYSCLSTGIAMVIHYVPEEEPTTLYYRLCVPNEDTAMPRPDELRNIPVKQCMAKLG